MTEYETLKRLVTEADEDVQKAIGGNKAAGTRVRKKMQEIKSAAQEVRKKILEAAKVKPCAPGRMPPTNNQNCLLCGGPDQRMDCRVDGKR